MMYLVLGQVYPMLEKVLIFFFLLDYGSHFMQFTANALVKNSSHKEMNDPKENFLVRFYYTNFPFFALIASGADTGLILGFLFRRVHVLSVSPIFILFTMTTTMIICLKMIINVSQLTGSVKKF